MLEFIYLPLPKLLRSGVNISNGAFFDETISEYYLCLVVLQVKVNVVPLFLPVEFDRPQDGLLISKIVPVHQVVPNFRQHCLVVVMLYQVLFQRETICAKRIKKYFIRDWSWLLVK